MPKAIVSILLVSLLGACVYPQTRQAEQIQGLTEENTALKIAIAKEQNTIAMSDTTLQIWQRLEELGAQLRILLDIHDNRLREAKAHKN